MPSVSLHSEATSAARRGGLRIGVAFSAIALCGVAFGLQSYYRNSLDASAGAQVKNFAFWVQVNDTFQIQRSLAALVEAEGLAAGQVVTSTGAELGYKGPPELRGSFGKTWSLVPRGILIVRSYPLRETGIDQQDSGLIRAAVVLPFSYFLWTILALMLITLVLIRSFERHMVAFVSAFTSPIKDLAEVTEAAESLSDLDQRIVGMSKYSEISSLEGKLKTMAARLVSQAMVERAAERAKDLFELSSQVAHDIRSPVSALKMVAQTSTTLEENRRNLLLSASVRIEKIADDLLARYRTQKSSEFLLLPSCTEIIEEKKLVCDARGITLEFNPAPTLDALQVLGNESDFKRMLSNLLNNSIEAISGEGKIAVQVEATSTGIVSLRISDTGPGISEKIIRQVRAGRVESTKENGNGLGLLHAVHLTRKWKGDLNIQSSPAGSEITVRLTAI